MPHLDITIRLDGAVLTHDCGPNCDCPRAIARTQQAIDWDRSERGAEPRALSERLRGMRNGTPEPEWFDAMAQRADVLETACGIAAEMARGAGAEAAAWAARCDTEDARTPQQRATAMHAAIKATVRDLERAHLIPLDHEYVYDANVGESLVWAGNRKFVAAMTGELDTPAAHYLVTTSSDADDEPGTERTTNNVDEVRAWVLAWSAAAVYA
jgi:hypothetical protein